MANNNPITDADPGTAATAPENSDAAPPLTDSQRSRLRSLIETVQTYLSELPQTTTDLPVYVVGGAVRDALLGRESNDWDFVTVGETLDSMLDRGFIDINASSFGVLHDTNHEEWALARTETKTSDGYKGISVETDDVTLYADLERRDLCINAMALHVNGPIPDSIPEYSMTPIETVDGPHPFIDVFNGRLDLEHGELRHVSDAFAEDPVRVLRAARYRARFQTDDGSPFTVHDTTMNLMRHVAPELNRMSRDRIGTEIVKAMQQARDPTAFWETLRDAGALAVIAPKLDRASIVPAGPEQYHCEGDTYTHTMMVLSRMHQLCEDRGITGVDRVRRYLMAVAHDLGKVTLADQQGGLWSDDPPRKFGGHAQTGVDDAAALADSLGLDDHYKCSMQDAAELHMQIHDLPTWSPAELIGFVDSYTVPAEAETPYQATLAELIDLGHADHEGRWQRTSEFDSPDAFKNDSEAPPDAVQPVFDRETFMTRIQAARTALETVSGYEALQTGLCDEHADTEIPDAELQSTLGTCDECRTPGSWVGDVLAEKRETALRVELP